MKDKHKIGRGYIYRLIMRIAHKFNWHYAPPTYPDGDTQLRCEWCGFRETIKRETDVDEKLNKIEFDHSKERGYCKNCGSSLCFEESIKAGRCLWCRAWWLTLN